VSAANRIVTRDVPKDGGVSSILQNYLPRAEQIGAKVVGSIAAAIVRRPNAAGESPLGDVIADAFLAAARGSGRADVAFMNQGGIRADLVPAAGPAPGSVSYRDLFAVQPFDNVLTVVTMTGEMMRRLLEEQFDEGRPGGRDTLQVSGTLTYRYRASGPDGQHVDPDSIRIGSRTLQPGDVIRVAAPDFVIDGGGGYRTFARGTGRVAVMSDLDAVVEYFRTHSPVAPGAQNRIIRVD
jgi:5'-nucleotidase